MGQRSASLGLGPIRLKRRSDLHIARKLWHMFGVLLVATCHYYLSTDQALRAMAVGAFICVTADVMRHQVKTLNDWALRIFGPFMREHERNGLAGTTYLVLGTFLIIWWFPREIVSLTLLFLAVADPLASFFGILYGKDKLIGSKSLQGSFAAFVACTVIAALFFLGHNMMMERLLIVSLLAGLSGAFSELLPVGRLDDNFTFPLVNSAMLLAIFTLFGGLS